MIYIKKNPPPTEFIGYVKTKGEDSEYRPTFDTMPKEVKDGLRLSLLNEQGFLCAYCMKPLLNSNLVVKIEHYNPRDRDNELDYNNLLAVCNGGEGQSYDSQTCDTHKGDTVLHIDPQNNQHMDMIFYRHDGKICISDELLQNDLDNVLNLNLGRLVAARRSALQAMQKKLYNKMRKKRAPKGYLENCLRLYENMHDNHLHGYCGILIWYLRKKIRQS